MAAKGIRGRTRQQAGLRKRQQGCTQSKALRDYPNEAQWHALQCPALRHRHYNSEWHWVSRTFLCCELAMPHGRTKAFVSVPAAIKRKRAGRPRSLFQGRHSGSSQAAELLQRPEPLAGDEVGIAQMPLSNRGLCEKDKNA